MDYAKKMARYTKIGDIWVNLTKYRKNLKPTGQCLEWTGGGHPLGYGMIGVIKDATKQHAMTVVHRVAMRMKINRELKSYEDVRHACENRRCCNPAHLFIREETQKNGNENEINKPVEEVSTL